MRKPFSQVPCLQGPRITLRGLELRDAASLQELAGSPRVYRYLPTFLFEQKYDSAEEVIRRLYTECLQESLILGIFLGEDFCGLAEMYGFRDPLHKISIGYRLLERYWGQGIASEALGLMVSYLCDETDIEIITASTMIGNRASARVLRQNDFKLIVHGADEDWGYETPTRTDKWIREDKDKLDLRSDDQQVTEHPDGSDQTTLNRQE
jgi:ribosomal-protein-alanine N-acetyltransferase